MIDRQLMRILNDISVRICFTGSQVIGGATPESDLDIVVMVASYSTSAEHLVQHGFVLDTSEEYSTVLEGNFLSAKKDKINVIMVQSEDYFDAWLEATLLATLNPMATTSKEYRHELFRAVWREKGLVE